MGKCKDDENIGTGQSEGTEQDRVDNHKEEDNHVHYSLHFDIFAQIGMHHNKQQHHEVVQRFEQHPQFSAFEAGEHEERLLSPRFVNLENILQFSSQHIFIVVLLFERDFSVGHKVKEKNDVCKAKDNS